MLTPNNARPRVVNSPQSSLSLPPATRRDACPISLPPRLPYPVQLVLHQRTIAFHVQAQVQLQLPSLIRQYASSASGPRRILVETQQVPDPAYHQASP